MAPENIIEGKNIDEAVKIASESFNIPVEKLKYDVITYGSTGIFGLVGVKKAKIRVHLPEIVKIETQTEIENNQKEVKSGSPERTAKRGQEKKGDNRGRGKFTGEKKKQPPEQRKDKDAAITEAIPPVISESSEAEETLEMELTEKLPAVLPEELKAFSDNPIGLGQAVLQRILEMITVDATVDVEKDEDSIIYNIMGGKAAVLIGKRGQTLEAIQYLIEKIVNRVSEKRMRVQIDVQGYLKNRKENLEELATRLAEKAKRIGKPVTVGEMNVHDRKIVHMALKDHRDVRTQSMGSGFYRKLMIFPKKNGGRKENAVYKEAENNKDVENNE